MLRIIREEEPPKPSTRLSSLSTTSDSLPLAGRAGEGVPTTLASIAANRGSEPKKLGGLVGGELDWIAMKALEKDRNRRFETASGFAADIQRYLDDEPVQACPPSAAYRFRKFARRNKTLLTAASLILLTLSAGMAGTTIGLFRVENARKAESAQRLLAQINEQKALMAAAAEKAATHVAETREAESRAILGFVEDKVFAAAGIEGEHGGLGREVTLREAIEAALPFIETSFPKQPNIEARLRTTLGVAYFNLGETSKAAEQFEKARALNNQWLGSDHPDTLMSMNYLANSYAELGLHIDALELRQETLALQKAKLGAEHPSTLWSMQNLAGSYRRLGRHAEALELTEQTLALMKVKLGPDDLNTLRSMTQLANNYAEHGRHIDALKLREETLALIKARFGPDHSDTLICMTNLANSYYHADRHDDALALREETLALQSDKLGPEHTDTMGSKSNLADSYANLGRHADALGLREETLASRVKKLGPDHPDTLVSMWGVADSLFHLNRSAEAGPIIEECLRRAEGQIVLPQLIRRLIKLRLWHFQTAKDATECRATAEMWENLQRTDANGLYDAACMRAITAAVVEHDPQTPAADVSRHASEDADRAMAWLKQAVSAGWSDAQHIKRDADLDALRDRADFQKLLADLEGRTEESVASAREAVRLEPNNAERRNRLIKMLNSRSWELATNDDPALRDAERAVTFAQEAVELAPQDANYWNTLGVALYRAGNWNEAITALQKFRELRTNDSEWSNPFFLAMAYWQLGQKEEARSWRDKAVEWMESSKTPQESLRRYRAEMEELMKNEPLAKYEEPANAPR